MIAQIRSIAADEWRLWRDVRIRAVADCPDAFRATLDEELKRPDGSWEDIIGSTVRHPRGGLWIAETDGEPMGMLFAKMDGGSRILSIGAMWVAPEDRGRGVGRRLVEEAIDWGRSAGAGLAELWVTRGNSAAMSLYANLGFESTEITEPLRDGSELVVTKLHRKLQASEPHESPGG